MFDLNEIRKLAVKGGWEEIDHQENIYMVSFRKKTARVNVYYSRMTVGTCISHPKKGKTQLFRRGVSLKLLGKIFENPRTHTGQGYYRA